MRAYIHKRELKDEHFIMAGAYGVGSVMTHSVIGQILISFAYALVFVFTIRERRHSSNLHDCTN